ncbi:DUF3606 domain-containing protein [Eleftheria terrae]|uniref:DUF3606 domain-containing protein n=1 Tax=Eleftheria terrae TaxID=1597781 RepID=UPI00263BB840|nr:DUF3606 domain-containing protein [Eleftheria terrae]WKB55914.1 DUF3606 domain-containing protein [Eleftheria terrae]
MSDNLQARGGQDRKRIDIGEDYELRYWADKFGVTREELREAVTAAGTTQADKVQAYLAHHRSTDGPRH